MTVATRELGRTGLHVSEVGHGLWGMGSWLDSDDRQSLAALRTSAAQGCTFFDSARAYGDGHSDALLAQLLKSGVGEHLVAASKVAPANGIFPARPTDAYDKVYPRSHVLSTVEQLREALEVDTVPLLQLHVWDDSWADASEFAAIVEELKGRRLVDHFGISLNRWEPQNGIRAVESGLVDTVQVIYNIFDQAPGGRALPGVSPIRRRRDRTSPSRRGCSGRQLDH